MEKGLEGFRSRVPRRGLRFGGNKKDERLPRWVGPAIRALCAGLDAGRAVQHVIAGVESVLFLPCPGTDDVEGEGEVGEERMEGKMPALIVAVLSFAIVRLTGEETDTKEYNQRVKKSLALLRDLREDEAMVAKVGEGEGDWEGWEAITKKDVGGWLKEISSQGWLRMDWWENIVDGSGASGHIEQVDDDDDIDEDRKAMEEERARLWRTRSGTMKQDEVDYLSETKRKQYARWKELMLVKIEGLDGGLAVDDMDIH
jgi:origin recognition complex subunit 6